MQNLLPVLLPRIESARLAGLDTGAGTIAPQYDGCALNNLPGSICRWLGAPAFGDRPLVNEILDQHGQVFQHVILLLVDGMGLNTLEGVLQRADHERDLAVWGEIASQGALAPLTSIVPSTTSAALTTLWTGRAPAAHGVVGYEVWLKEYGMIANMILHAPASYAGDVGSLSRAGFDPQTFLPTPTLGPHLKASGVQVNAFQHHSIVRSGLSTMLMTGVDVQPFRSLGDLWVSLQALLDSQADQRSYTYIYWGDLDEHEHRYGTADARVALEFANFSRQLGYFVRQHKSRARGDTLLLITADHGHLDTPRQARYELRGHPDLQECLVMSPSGEARLPFAFLRPGREEQFLRYLEAAWPGEFLAVPSAQAVEAGLFGSSERYSRLIERIGDYVVIPQGSAYWWFAARDNPLLGRHGGMSRTEMLVPLLSLVL